jgi:hypothetical protein
VYSVSFVRPVTVIGLDEPVAVIPSGLEVTVYVGESLYVICPEKEIVDSESPPSVAVTVVGAIGEGVGQASPRTSLRTLLSVQIPSALVVLGNCGIRILR